MKELMVKRTQLSWLIFALIVSIMIQQPVAATPFGQGVFSADVPFGSGISMTIDLGGNVALDLLPSGSTFVGTASHTVTVTSTDAVGYKLFAYSPNSSAMTNGSYAIPASSNSSPAPLSTNTWGYNTDGSSNFIGMTTTPAVIKDANGPFKNGDATTVTYKALTDITKGAGAYTVGVVYTAVAK